jgi:aspartyl aminopeptidase
VPDILNFIDASPSPYHAVLTIASALDSKGFKRLYEGEAWGLAAGQAYYVTRADASIAAFICGTDASARCRIICAHTDSPVLKLKANPYQTSRNLSLLNVAIYGSALLHTWLDRDLKLAGKVFFADDKGGVTHALVNTEAVLLRAVSLAPHLKAVKKIESLNLDLQKDLVLFYGGQAIQEQAEFENMLRNMCAANDRVILGYDLSLADVEPCRRVGVNGEFLSAPRIDNLFSCYTAMQALIRAKSEPTPQTRLMVGYDAEEIGSQTYAGARGDFLDMLIHRLSGAGDIYSYKARSLIVSADMAHAEHPAFPEATDPDHVPLLGGGLAVKSSAKGNYANGHEVTAWLKNICRIKGFPLQTFSYRCDHGGGSSVGPLVTTASGIKGMDVGAPMLGMHSIREMCALADVESTIDIFEQVYNWRDNP